MENLFASVVGTLCAEIITLPICTVKTVYQNNNNLTISQTIRNIYSSSGYKGFMLAYTPAIVSQVISTSSKYYFYEIIKSYRKTEKSDLLNNSINGLVGGILGSIFAHPIDVWKNYIQRDQKFPFYNLKVFYQGYNASIYKNAVLYSCLFPIYDFYSEKISNAYLASFCTSLTISLIIQPFDYYKTIKIAGNKPTNWYRGYTIMLARSLPHFAITMSITEYIKNNFFIKN
jgi:hypothetical protein